tara:strand:+ start:100 stop:438 length:339 start_codon:yes stop_codon:yes gene_type:complete
LDIYIAVDKAIDEVFENDRFVLNLYQLATSMRLKRNDMSEFLHSSVAGELKNTVLELDEYLKGGRDSHHQQLREAYGHIPKPKARKIRNYLYGIIQDAYRYERDRKPGRKKA